MNSVLVEPDHKLRVQSFYDQHRKWQGEIYATHLDPHALGVRRRVGYVFSILDALLAGRTGTAVDVGCGPGTYLNELAHRGFRCQGVDLSPEMLVACERHLDKGSNGNIRLLQGDVESIPLESQSADLLLCIGVLQYLVSPVRALAEIHRVTKPNGLVVICVENMMSLSHRDWVVRRKLRSLLSGRLEINDDGLTMVSDWFLHVPTSPHEYRLYNPWKFEALMTSKGFERVDAMTYGFGFRLLRRMRIFPDALLNRVEVWLERIIRHHRFSPLSYLGEFYIGIFRRLPAPADVTSTPSPQDIERCAITSS
jgi:ubiquinone/menaquinone biosynthesis C-methylase UbiE